MQWGDTLRVCWGIETNPPVDECWWWNEPSHEPLRWTIFADSLFCYPSGMAESWITSRIHVIPMLSTGPMAALSLPACPAQFSSPSSCPSVGDQHYPYNLSVLTPTTTSYLISTCHLNKQIIFLPGQPISSFLYTYILNNHWLLYNLISGLLVRPKRKPQLKHHFLADTFF